MGATDIAAEGSAGRAETVARRRWGWRTPSATRDPQLAAEPGRRAALRMMRRFRIAVVVFGAGGVVAALLCHSNLLLGLTLVIAIEEMLEGSVVIGVLRGKGRIDVRRAR